MAVVFAFLGALAPGIAWLLFFLKEDLNPEPKKLLTYTFLAGMLSSAPIILIQVFTESVLSSLGLGILFSILFFAFIEEFFKFFSVYITVGGSRELDEPVDFMIYMITSALGLATIENFFILINIMSSGSSVIFSDVANILIIRFVGATFLHALASGFMGYYWAVSTMKNKKTGIPFGIFVATLIHSLFNILVLIFEGLGYLIYPSLFLLSASIFLFKDFSKLKKSS